jgi:hypothetical protein
MKMLAEYLERAINFELMAAEEKDDKRRPIGDWPPNEPLG